VKSPTGFEILQTELRSTRAGLNGGRAWWAHFEFTRINIEPIILRKKIEDLPERGHLQRRTRYIDLQHGR
jgi:hypothetical protein